LAPLETRDDRYARRKPETKVALVAFALRLTDSLAEFLTGLTRNSIFDRK